MTKIPTIDIDFETFSKEDITKVGLQNYALHPSTDIICMAYKLPGDITRLWRPGREHKLPPQYVLRAHNVNFELAILKYNKHGLPFPTTFECTAAKASVMTYPRSLEEASKAMGLSIQKDTEGRGVMLQVTKPRIPSKTNYQENWFFDKEKMKKTYRYCIQDVNVEEKINEFTQELHPFEQKIFELDYQINQRGIGVDWRLADAAIKIAEDYQNSLNNKAFWMTDCKLNSLTKVSQLKKYLVEDLGMEIESLAKDKLQALIDDPKTPKKAVELLELRQKASLTSIAKYKKILEWMSPDDRIRNLLLYYGANTGRWTGKGPQLHNLPRGNFKGDKEKAIKAIRRKDLPHLEELGNIPDILSSCIRETFQAQQGHTFIAGDYSGIELRVLAWLSGDNKLLQKLEDGVDPYVDMASSIYSKPPEKISPDERAIGKMAVLGLGYGMGAPKFREQCALQGIEVSEAFAKEVVKAYRRKYDYVTELWYELNHNFMQTVRDTTSVHGTKVPFTHHGGYITATLPSGRPLYYIKPRLQQGKWGEEATHMKVNSLSRKWERRKTYGGMLCENIVQAIARDVLAEAMLRLDEYFNIVLHVHDEIIVEKELTEHWDLTVNHFIDLMEQKPDWAQTLPISVDAWTGDRYKKG